LGDAGGRPRRNQEHERCAAHANDPHRLFGRHVNDLHHRVHHLDRIKAAEV
jgi:hypothetical protein